MSRGDVFITYHTTSVATALDCDQNKFNTGASYIFVESTKKSVCEKHSEKKPTQDVSFMAYTIDKQVFS